MDIKNNNIVFTVATVISILCVIAVVIAGYFFIQNIFSPPQSNTPKNNQPVAENSQNQIPGWNTLKDARTGFQLQYPNDFFDPGHQPKILVGNCDYAVFPDRCPNIGSVIASDADAQGNYLGGRGILSRLTLGGATYCALQTSDAATGHVYNYYYYTTVKNQQCVVVFLATSSTNCDVYLPSGEGNADQQKNYHDCVAKNKEQPILLHQIISTFR